MKISKLAQIVNRFHQLIIWGQSENEIQDRSNKIFVMKSLHCPKHMNWDHIGFILNDGTLKDMSGHRYDEVNDITAPPLKSNYDYYKEEEFFKLNSKDQEERYEEYQLPVEIPVPDKLKYSNPENCGSYVLGVINDYLIDNDQGGLNVASYTIDDIYNAIKSQIK